MLCAGSTCSGTTTMLFSFKQIGNIFVGSLMPRIWPWDGLVEACAAFAVVLAAALLDAPHPGVPEAVRSPSCPDLTYVPVRRNTSRTRSISFSLGLGITVPDLWLALLQRSLRFLLAGPARWGLAWISTGANSPNSDRQHGAICVWLGVPIRPRSLV